MHAIINNGNGDYYVSYVFGRYHDINYNDRPELDASADLFIIWNKDKTKIIAYPSQVLGTRYILPLVTIIDVSGNEWFEKGDDNCCVDFLSKETIESLLNTESQPEDILEKCREADKDYKYRDIREINTGDDVKDFLWAVGGFHDAFIDKYEIEDDGTLHVTFDGVWGLKAELWFSGDIAYNIPEPDPDYGHEIWYDSSLLLSDGFKYLVDFEGVIEEDLGNLGKDCTWFKSKKINYRLTPLKYAPIDPKKEEEDWRDIESKLDKMYPVIIQPSEDFEYGMTWPDDADKYNNKGAFYYRDGDYKKAVEYYRLAATLGDVHAVSNLGYCYLYGRGIDVDVDLAVAYFQIAARNMDVDAAYKLGNIYESDKWNMKNDQLSKYYYRLAASFIYEDGLERLYMPDGAEVKFKLFPSLCLAIAKLLLNDEELINTEEAKKFLDCAKDGYEECIDRGETFYEKSLNEVKALLGSNQLK